MDGTLMSSTSVFRRRILALGTRMVRTTVPRDRTLVAHLLILFSAIRVCPGVLPDGRTWLQLTEQGQRDYGDGNNHGAATAGAATDEEPAACGGRRGGGGQRHHPSANLRISQEVWDQLKEQGNAASYIRWI